MGDLFFEVVGRRLYESKRAQKEFTESVEVWQQLYHVTQPGDNARVGIGYHGSRGFG
jgi:hypothetical protein